LSRALRLRSARSLRPERSRRTSLSESLIKIFFWILIPALLFLTVSLLPLHGVSARPASAASAFDIIAAVNDLRASYGLPPYAVSQILMGTAQGQAEYMASIGSWSHIGPGGISYTQRLLNAGYPLSGGFRAENVLTIKSDISGYDVVHSYSWADAEHQNTMLSVELTEIGAGVAVREGMGYYVIDCARSTSSGVVQPLASKAPVIVNGTPVTQAPSQILSAVVLSTPREDGAVYHDVQYGQSLWSIAIAYDTKIDEIKRLNNLTSNDIYLGQKLLIKNAGTSTPTAAAVTQTKAPQLTSTSATILAPDTAAVAATPTLTAKPQANAKSGGWWIWIIIIVALLAAGIGTWLGTKKTV